MEVVASRQDALPPGWAVFGLTTEERPERRAHLRGELLRSGFGGRVLVARRPDEADGFRSPGSRGCVESHLACLRAAHEQGVEVCIIAEDDLLVAPGAAKLVRTIARELEDREWSTVYLGHLPASPVRSQRVHPLTRHVVRSEGWEVLGAHFVAVHRRALPALIENFERRFLPGGHRIDSDGIHNEFRRDAGLDTLICVPNMAIQGPSPSGITVTTSLRTRALHHSWVRRLVQAPKRTLLGLGRLVPSRLAIARWNRRAERAHATPAG